MEGITVMETSAALRTVRVAGVAAEIRVPKTLVIEALIFALVPTAPSVVVARPGVVVLIVTLDSDELHVTPDVMFWVELSVYVPVAVNCCVFPAATVVVPGVIAIDTKVADVTFAPVEPVIPERLALMVGVPTETAVISPPTTVALAPLEDQVAWEVMSCVLPSL
jgi:hypothetical protein